MRAASSCALLLAVLMALDGVSQANAGTDVASARPAGARTKDRQTKSTPTSSGNLLGRDAFFEKPTSVRSTMAEATVSFILSPEKARTQSTESGTSSDEGKPRNESGEEKEAESDTRFTVTTSGEEFSSEEEKEEESEAKEKEKDNRHRGYKTLLNKPMPANKTKNIQSLRLYMKNETDRFKRPKNKTSRKSKKVKVLSTMTEKETTTTASAFTPIEPRATTFANPDRISSSAAEFKSPIQDKITANTSAPVYRNLFNRTLLTVEPLEPGPNPAAQRDSSTVEPPEPGPLAVPRRQSVRNVPIVFIVLPRDDYQFPDQRVPMPPQATKSRDDVINANTPWKRISNVCDTDADCAEGMICLRGACAVIAVVRSNSMPREMERGK